jgi:hypothetical protein
MVNLINAFTGTEMWVADERQDEYIAAGHKLAAAPVSKPTKVVDEEPKKVAKATVKKATTKKK